MSATSDRIQGVDYGELRIAPASRLSPELSRNCRAAAPG
jgi:hypothetical protein